MDRRVEGRVVEHEGFGARREIDADAGMMRAEVGQARDQPARGEGRDRREFEHAAGATMRHQRKRVVLQAIEVFTHLPRVKLPRLGKRHALLDAIEQRNAEILLQRRNLPADGTLGQRQLLRGAREALVSRGRFESNQELRPRNFSSHGIHSRIAQHCHYTLIKPSAICKGNSTATKNADDRTQNRHSLTD